MITSEEVNKIVRYSTKKYISAYERNTLRNYLLQQEKVNELLGLYREKDKYIKKEKPVMQMWVYDKWVTDIDVLNEQIKALESELNDKNH